MAQQIPGFTPDPEGFIPDGFTPDTEQPVSNEAPVLSSPAARPSFLSRAWEFGTTPLIPVTEPTIEEWSRNPRSSATRSALSQATSPLAIIGELAGGVGLLRGIKNLRSRVPQVAKAAVEPVDDFLSEASIRPQFNPKGQTKLTGAEQLKNFQIPENVQRITIKKNTAQMTDAARKQGFIPGGITSEGFPFMIRGKQAEPIIRKMKDAPPQEAGAFREAWNLARGLMPVDLPFISSAAFRQALPMAGTRNWFRAWAPSFKSWGSENAFRAHYNMLKADPLSQRTTVPVLNIDGTQRIVKGSPVFKEQPSILERAGIELNDLTSFTGREESIRSSLAEKIPIWGRYVRASNRGYSAYLNDLRVNAFRNMYEAMPDKNNLEALKQLGDAINTFTGRGPLKTKIPGGGRNIPLLGRIPEEVNIERHANGLAEVLFSPRLMASRMQMLNPVNYTMMKPQVRKEYMKAALRTAGAWTTVAGLGNLSGLGETSLDPRSADFGKIRIGNTRIDPAGGFQQFLVLASRLYTNEFTSSTPEVSRQRPVEMGGGGPYDQTRGSVATQFGMNKLHPMLRYFIDSAFASQDTPFHVFDRTAQLALPMMAADLLEIAKEEPDLLPMLAPLASAGMGAQFYEKGSFNEPAFVPSEFDINLGERNILGRNLR